MAEAASKDQKAQNKAAKIAPKVEKGLKFSSGARQRSATYVIRAERHVKDLTTGTVDVVPGIRVVFKEHKFDLDRAAEVNGWTEEDKALIVHKLTHHQDWGASDGRGIFYDTASTRDEIAVRMRGAQRRCGWMFDIGEGDQVQCNAFIENDADDYCPTHQEEAENLVRSVTPS